MLKISSDSGFYSQLQRNARAMIVSRYEQQVVGSYFMNIND
jgi:hypothetical protein